MSRWFRFYDDAVNDPKIIKLSDDIFRAWVNLLCVASKHGGMLPAADDIAIILRVKVARAAAIIAELVSFGLIDKTETGFVPHNWNGRQFKSDVSTDRVKRFRNAGRNVSETVSETVCSVSVSESVSKTSSKKEDSSDFEFEDFWNLWPNKVGKPAALKAFAAARKRGAPFGEIMDGVRRYIREKPPDRPWLNPATFLNQERWSDQPAATSVAKPLTEFQLKQRKTNDVTEQLKQSALAERGGGAPDRFLSYDHGERS